MLQEQKFRYPLLYSGGSGSYSSRATVGYPLWDQPPGGFPAPKGMAKGLDKPNLAVAFEPTEAVGRIRSCSFRDEPVLLIAPWSKIIYLKWSHWMACSPKESGQKQTRFPLTAERPRDVPKPSSFSLPESDHVYSIVPSFFRAPQDLLVPNI